MRILYGAYAMGHGHFSKAAVLVPLLEARGHEVRVVSSGADDPPAGYAFRWHRHFPGLAYAVTDGRTDYKASFKRWAKDVPRVARHLWQLRRIANDFQPDLVLSDFEPLSANPFVNTGCEVVALSRQVALCDAGIPLPPDASFERKMTKTVTRLFTIGADRSLGYHYEPASFRCVPPVVRAEIDTVRPTVDEHVFVYNSVRGGEGGSAAELLDWANRRRQRVVAYGYRDHDRGEFGPVTFRAPSRQGLLDDLASAKAVMCTAGLSTPVEAILLGKPVAVVPIPGHFEQLANGYHLDAAGLASWCPRWDYDRLLELASPAADHPALDWLRTPPDRVLDVVLGERTPRPAEGVERRAA